MTYQPVIPMGGNAGWSFLKRTREVQQAAFDNSAKMQRDVDYFRENIGNVKSADDLMKDRRLLSVALGAVGLDADIDKTFLVHKVLAEGAENEDSLANKLRDGRYLSLAETFGFDREVPATQDAGFADRIVAAYKTRQFEVAVGEQDPNMRFALGLDRELDNLLEGDLSDNGLWYSIMATKPLRAVFEGAFNLPPAVGALDIDRQLDIFKEKSRAAFGDESPRALADPEKREELVRLFFARSEMKAAGAAYSAGSVALSLLQSIPRPSLFG